MAIGDLNISSLKIGDLDLTEFSNGSFAGFNIYESILNPYGPVGEIRVIDHSDALTKDKITGSYDKDVEFRFSPDDNILDGGGQTTMKFKLFKNKDLDDMSKVNTGSGHAKQYDLRFVSEEHLNAQGNYVSKSFKGKKTSDMVEHVLKEGFKTKKKVNLGKTKGVRDIIISNEHPLKALHRLNTEHVSDKYESSCFVTFQKGGQNGHEYHFKTFEELFEQQPVVKLYQSTELDYGNKSDKDKQNSMIWFKPSDSFYSGSRAMSKPSEQTIDLTTHKVVSTKPKDDTKFVFADKDPVYKNSPSYVKEVPIKYQHDKANNSEKHQTSQARTKRASFLSHLAQNSAELEVYYNPKITLGSMIEIDIPQKADMSEGGESQFNGKCLVVAIRTKYKMAADPPKCTMILRVVKASYKKGTGDA